MICSRLNASVARTSNLSTTRVVYWSHGTSPIPETPCRQRFHCCLIWCKMIHTKGPDTLGKKNVINSLRQVCPVFFRSTKFYQGLPNFKKDAAVLPRSRTNFCQAWNLTDLSIYTPWFEGKCQSRKIDLIFSWSISVQSPPKLNLCLRGNPTINLEDSYLCLLYDDPFAQYSFPFSDCMF